MEYSKEYSLYILGIKNILKQLSIGVCFYMDELY